jgi:21S rRNA (GM2251-2'-O)-methyltransferase
MTPDSVPLGRIDKVLRDSSDSSPAIDSDNSDNGSRNSLSIAVVLGNEGNGLRTNILRRCDALVQIAPRSDTNDRDIDPQATTSPYDTSTVDSLNVGVAGGILLHHFLGK